MTDIKIEIQGENAIAAREEFFSIPGVSGNWQKVDEIEKGELITTILAIVGITSGSIGIGEKIYNWYQKYKKRNESGKKIEKVLIVGKNGKRLLLEDATIEQIKEILDD